MNPNDDSHPKIARLSIAKAIETLLEMPEVRQTVVYQHPKAVVKATRQFRRHGGEKSQTILVTIGGPAYRERQFVKACLKAGEPFPVRKVQIRGWPVPRVCRRGVDSSR